MQLPWPLHWTPPLCEHVLPAGAGTVLGTPLMHAPDAHWLPLAGVSVLSTVLTMFPAPSHWFWRQSPGVWTDVGKPARAFSRPHAPATHIRV
jgi:hypothetical protein